MYYNKMEALREKEVAEKLIIDCDYVSARDKLLKARQLFPAIEHIVAMLTVCDILSASKNKIPGYETDYYWILHLIPSSSFSDVRCRYQKLLNLLQPIKNKFAGTDVALKLIEEAVSVLSDKDKRSSFDVKRETSWANYESFDVQAASSHCISGRDSGITAQISSQCGMVCSGEMLEGKNRIGLPTDVLPERRSDNLNKHPNISFQEPSASSSNVNSQGNTGEEIDMPVDNMNLPLELQHSSLKETPSLSLNAVTPKKFDQDFYDFGEDRKPEFFETGQIWATHYLYNKPHNCRYAQITTNLKSAPSVGVTWLKPLPVTNGERRWCDAGLPVACGSFCLELEKDEQVSSPTVFSYNCSWTHGVTEEQFEIYPKKGEIWALYEDWDLDEWSYNPESVKGCKLKLVEILSDFSKYLGADCACLTKTDGFRSIFQRLTEEGNPVILHISPNNLYMMSHKVPAYRFSGGEISGVFSGMFELDLLSLQNDTISDTDNQITSNMENSDSSNFTGSAELTSLPSLKPYPETKILEPNWSLNDITAGQVWAVFCGKDLMPRQYARINNVSSGNQVCVTLLEHQPIYDFEKTWKKESPPFMCGIYGATGTNLKLEMTRFSHVVRCQQSPTKLIYKIYPMKYEIWAMYKNWNTKWKQTDYETSQFDVVEILSDISEGSGIMIAKLRQVKGYLTFFHRQQFDGFDLTRLVSKVEMLSFSHRIPAFRVPGIGQHGIPESSWHLEPNALPCHCDYEPSTAP